MFIKQSEAMYSRNTNITSMTVARGARVTNSLQL